MAKPVRYPSGVSTFPPRHLLSTFPSVMTPVQVGVGDDFLPYRAAGYNVTTAVAGTVANFGVLGGGVKMATSASATDTIYLARGGPAFQFTPLNQVWCDTRLAYPRTVLNANDTNIYWGLFDNAVPTSANNGVYFFSPAGGTAVHFVIKKAGTVTTFQNVGDLALPSGLYGDTASVNGTLNATISGTAFSAISVATPGSGYEWQPLVLTTATSGTAGNNVASVGLGSTAYVNGSNPQAPVQSTQLPYSSLYAPMLTDPSTGYTNGTGTNLLEVVPFLNYHFWYDGRGTIYVGVNGRVVMSLGGNAVGQGVNPVAAGATINLATSSADSFSSAAQLSTSVSPVQPAIGSAMNMLPLTQLRYGIGFANTTANIRSIYVCEYMVAEEIA